MSAAQNTALKAVPLDHPVNKKPTAEWVDLTPALAEKWLGQNHENRNQRDRKIKAYARDMRNGEWITTGQTIQFDWNGNMIDGQHRCESVIESGATIRVLVVKGLTPDAKRVIDTGIKRSPADALKFAGYTHDLNVTAAVARIAMARDAGYLRTAFAGNAADITNPETVSWVDGHPEVTSAVALARKTASQIGIAPSPWAYSLWELMHVHGPYAVEFATSMHEYRGLRGKGDPRLAMLTAFRNAKQGQRRVPQTAESIYIVFRAWNAWVTNKSLVSVVPRDPNGKGNDIPKLLAPNEAFKARYFA